MGFKGNLKIQLAKNQKQAVKEAIEKKVNGCHRGPDTGKTTIINSNYQDIYGRLVKEYYFPPRREGRLNAMAEATGHESKTIHRLFGFSPNGRRPSSATKITPDAVS